MVKLLKLLLSFVICELIVGNIKQVFVGEKLTTKYHYLRQEGYVFVVVCLPVC